MLNRLWVRLSLGFSGMVIATAFVMALIGIVIGWLGHERRPRWEEQFWQTNLDHYLETQLSLSEQLTAHYQAEPSSWQGIAPHVAAAQAQLEPQEGPFRVMFIVADADKQLVYHPHADWIGDPLSRLEPLQLLPLRVAGQTVGYLGLDVGFNLGGDRRGPPDNPLALFVVFAGSLLVAATLLGIIGSIFGVLMSRSLTAPLNNLVSAAQAIGSRNLSQRVAEQGSMEMQAVAQAFNDMAADLEQAETLRRNLLADVAHELRTPLSVLQGNLRAILDGVYPLEQQEIARLYDHTRFLSRLVNDLHELAQAEAKKLPLSIQPVDLQPLLKLTGETFRPPAEAKGLALQLITPDSLPNVNADSARLRQVLQNLLANALRHTPSGGRITLHAKQNGPHVHLSISDTGEGIAPEALPHIFDRFYRTDPARTRDRGGAGLGLAITRAIIEAHGGSIQATSPGQNQGTTFTISLPIERTPYST